MSLIRTQVQLTGEQLAKLRRISTASGQSIAELVRTGVDCFLAGKAASHAEDRIGRALKVAGRFSSGRADVSEEHDRHLAEAYRR